MEKIPFLIRQGNRCIHVNGPFVFKVLNNLPGHALHLPGNAIPRQDIDDNQENDSYDNLNTLRHEKQGSFQ
jgi:hypothetical protein